MFHGQKKKERKEITEEETKKLEETLEKIKAIQKKILNLTETNGDYIEKNLEFLLKASSMMADFYTIWNVRKKIILSLQKTKTDDENYAFIITEIKQLIPLMSCNPKSYVLWYHR